MSIKTYDVTSALKTPDPDPRGRQIVNYGCKVSIIVNDDWGCMICAGIPSISFDSSEGEYFAPSLCLSCIKKMFTGKTVKLFGGPEIGCTVEE